MVGELAWAPTSNDDDNDDDDDDDTDNDDDGDKLVQHKRNQEKSSLEIKSDNKLYDILISAEQFNILDHR